MKISVIMAKEPGNVSLEIFEREESQFQDHDVMVQMDYSAISAGTECAWISGHSNNAGQKFPFYPGYSGAGHVCRIGGAVRSFAVGDRVIVVNSGHRSHVILNEEDALRNKLYRIGDPSISLKDAAFSYIFSFPMLGVRRLHLQMGESVMIAGLGILGQFAVQIARLNGAVPLYVCDMDPARRELALKNGADAAFDPSDPDFIEQVRKATSGRGVNAVVEVTGKAAALQQALKYTAKMGRISLLGCTRVPEGTIDFYRDVHLTGISIIGCHTSNRPGTESRPGEWTTFDDFRTFLQFLATGRIRVSPLISRIVSPKDCHEIYNTLINTKNPPMGLVYDWSTL